MIEGILIGLKTALSFQNLIMVMIGCFAGTIIGMLPGLGPMTAIALMIPITYGFDPATGLILMAGVYYGAVFGGSTSSILINAPGVPGTVATSFDGYGWLFFWNNHWNASWSWSNDSYRINDTNHLWF